MTLSVRVATEALSARSRRNLTLTHGQVLVNSGTHLTHNLAVHEEHLVQRQGGGRRVHLEFELAEAHDARIDAPRLALQTLRALVHQLCHRHVLVLFRGATVQREADARHGSTRLPGIAVEARALQVVHRPCHVDVARVGDVLVGDGRHVEQLGECGRVGEVRPDGTVGVDQHRAVIHTEHAARVEGHGMGGGLTLGAVQLEGDHVLLGVGAHRVEDDVELGGGRVDHGSDGLGLVREGLRQVEARHLAGVEIGGYTALVGDLHIQHGVVVHVGDGELAADVRRHFVVHADSGGLAGGPLRSSEGHGVPVSRSHGVLEVHPIIVLDLEGKVGREHGADGRRSRHLTHLEADRTHIDGQVVTGRLHPTICTRFEELKSVNVVGQTPIGVVQVILCEESVNTCYRLASGGLASEQLVGALIWPVVQTCHQCDE